MARLVRFADAGQERAVRFAVELVEDRDEKFDGLADLAAELFGDFFLAFEGFGEQGRWLVFRLGGLEAGAGEEGDEPLQGLRLLAEKGGVPHRGTGRGAASSMTRCCCSSRFPSVTR